jgi:hypothetical protein
MPEFVWSVNYIFTLVSEFGSKLNYARITGIDDLTESGRSDLSTDGFKLSVVKGAESLDAKLHPDRLLDLNVFQKRYVEIVDAGTAHGEYRSVADASDGRDALVGVDVEVASKAGSSSLPEVADEVRALGSGATAEISDITRLVHVDRKAAHEGRNAGNLPAAECGRRGSALTLKEWQLPDVVEAEHVCAIEFLQAEIQILIA